MIQKTYKHTNYIVLYAEYTVWKIIDRNIFQPL